MERAGRPEGRIRKERAKHKVRHAGVVAVLAVLLASCNGEEQSGEKISLLRADAPLQAPVWEPEEGVIFALRQADSSVVKAAVTPGGVSTGDRALGATVSSEGLESVGENFAPDLVESDQLYVPQPGRDRITVVGGTDLLNVRSFEVDPSPSRVTLDGPVTENSGLGDTLFAISENGSTLTGVRLNSVERVLQREVEVGSGALLEASEAGEGREVWVGGSRGVVFYNGSSLIRFSENPSLGVGALAVDPDDQRRAYVGDSSSGRLVVVEAKQAGSLQTVDEVDIDGSITKLTAEGDRIYAATTDSLVVLDLRSLDTVATVEFADRVSAGVSRGSETSRSTTSTGPADSPGGFTPSGIALSEENVYVAVSQARRN